MKKGQEELMFVFSLILIVLVLTLFFIVVSVVGNNRVEEKITSMKSNEVNIDLLNYLKTKTSFNDLTFSELIAYSYSKKDYNEIEKLTKKQFDKYYSQETCNQWILKAEVNNEELFDSASDFSLSSSIENQRNPFSIFTKKKINYASSSAFIPGFNSEKIIAILILGCENE
ncbi:MAG: hypothetical protein AABW56_04535 [Nanoarchaeota archaeon]